MSSKKIPIEVNAASMVELKAELFRKQEQFKREKLTENADKVRKPAASKKPSLFTQRKNSQIGKKPTGEMDRKTLEEIAEEENALRKSRAKLEEKAALYDKMVQSRNGIVNNDKEKEENLYMVDFEKKQMAAVREKRRKQFEVTEEEEVKIPIPEPTEPSEEWVEYVDGLGRTRTCLKKDLPEMMEMVQSIGGVDPKDVPLSERTLMSEDMHRELMRQKWEEEEEEMMAKPEAPIHYQNVRHDEIRNHGVGYFQFSKDDTERQQQLEELNRLRNQTLDQREKRGKLKAKRKAALEARLEKVKQRKLMKAVSDGKEEATEEEAKEEEEEMTPTATVDEMAAAAVVLPPMDDSFIAAAISSIRKQVDEARTEGNSAVEKLQGRHWNVFRHEDLEAERPDEFAPPSSYLSAKLQMKGPGTMIPPPPPPSLLAFNMPPPPFFPVFPPPGTNQ